VQFAPIAAHQGRPGRGDEKVDERNDFSPFMAKSEFSSNKYLCFVVRSARSVRLLVCGCYAVCALFCCVRFLHLCGCSLCVAVAGS